MRYWDHRQLAPTDLQEGLQAAVPARVHYEHQWVPNYQPGLGLPLDWFTSNQQLHIGSHHMRSLPTMTVLAERAHCNVQLHESACCAVVARRRPNMCGRAWCRPTNGARLHTWLTTYVGPRASQIQGQLWDPAVLEQWAAAIAAPSLRMAHIGQAGLHDIKTEFIQKVVKESQRVWLLHAKAREGLIKAPRTRGHHGVGPARAAIAPAGGAARGQGGLELDPPHAGASPTAAQVHTRTPCRAHVPARKQDIPAIAIW